MAEPKVTQAKIDYVSVILRNIVLYFIGEYENTSDVHILSRNSVDRRYQRR